MSKELKVEDKLAPEEIELASKYIKRLEQDAGTAKFVKWVILLIALVVIGFSFKLLLQSQELGRMNTAESLAEQQNIDLSILDKYIDARSEGREIKTDLLSKYIDARLDIVRLEFAAGIKSYSSAMIGGLMIGVFIMLCYRSEKSRLIVKALRMMIALSKDDQNKTSSNNRVQ